MSTMQELLEEDRRTRERIVRETEENFFVEASAGSGKTTLLVSRMLAMVEHGADIRRICAITFTRNAASEFYSRFRTELSRKSYDPALPEEKRERFLYALQNIDLCFMGTIDSFCQRVLQEHPMEAGIPSGWTPAMPDGLLAAGRAELLRAANGAYGPQLRERYARLAALIPNADGLILEQLTHFMELRDAKHIYEEPACDDFEQAHASEIREIRTALKVLAEHPEYCYTGKIVKKTGEFKATQTAVEGKEAVPAAYDAARRPWNRNLSRIAAALAPLKKLRLACAPEKIGLGETGLFRAHNDKCEWYDCTVAEPGRILEEIREMRYGAFLSFMVPFADAAAREIRKKGELSFYDAQLCLLEMLRRDAAGSGALFRHITQRHSYFLIDEFQDTSPLQAELFFLLAAEQPEEDWRLCRARRGALFIVGDPKQSIYRFRSADVSSYLAVKKLFCPPFGETVGLTRNFRSRPGLCRSFNALYSGLLPEEREEQSRFSPIPLPETGDGEEEGLCGIYSYSSNKNAELDAEFVARLIRRLVGDPSVRIRDGETLRSIGWHDIMVITRTKKHLDAYLSTCAEQGIPAFVEGMTIFSECKALKAAAAVMKALSAPGDPLAVYGALRSGLFDVNDAMLSECCRGEKKITLFSAEEERLERFPVVRQALKSLQTLLGTAHREPPAALLAEILDELDIFARMGTEHLEYVPFAQELLRRGERDGSISGTAEAAQYLSNLMEDQTDLERSLNLTGEPDCVHFANLHKVKGLEAPVVILAEPKPERAHTPRSRTECCGGRRETILFDAGYGISTKKYEDKKDAEKRSDAAESVRLLYVAGTRAKNLLIVSSSPEGGHFWSPILTHAEEDIFRILPGEGIVPKEAPILSSEEIRRQARQESLLSSPRPAEPTFCVSLPSSARVPSRLEEEETAGEAEEADLTEETKAEETHLPARKDAALVGTMVHRMMEILVSSRNRADAEETAEAIVSEYLPPEEKGEEYRLLLQRTAERMRAGGNPQEGKVPQDILSEALSAEEVFCELPFCCREGETVWHGIMDLVYCKNGAWHIVDYKTSADPDDLDEKYRAQLSAYQQAFRTLTGRETTAGTYHIDTGGGHRIL